MPDVPAPPAAAPTVSIDLRVSKRLLWIGDAVYPLRNIARVHTFTIHPRRKEAALLFFKRAAITLSGAIGLTLLSAAWGGLHSFGGRSDGGAGTLLVFVWLGAAAALIWSGVELASVLTAQSHYVLSVETSGPSIAVVTSANPGHLRQLVGYLTNAIEHPETEFHVRVEALTISPKNYYFGDNVNMYGGSGNVGMANS
ncbi:DUF6232 family protein [Streptomyces sp. NPDC050485]|uniref:DUF6232 family protein n=1 Tax=Streptomyces sp. NPDC050485 TaxID=3365617 RepID=UPI0037AA39FE